MYKNRNDMSYRIFVINPGSTSTKLAYFEDEKKLYEENVFHDSSELAGFASAYDQLDFRKQMILEFLDENGIDLHGVDAIVGRGGSTAPINSGVYRINDKLLEDTRNMVTGVDHPANLGVPLAAELVAEYGGLALMVDGPKVDEFIDEARITGMAGLYRGASLHVLNLVGTARMHCRDHGMDYRKSNLIVCHIDGGMSISAHYHGRMIDGTNNAWGEGPFTPTRTGALPAQLAVEYFREGGACSDIPIRDACTRAGGLVLSGEVDAIICGGGLLRFDDLCDYITKRCSWIAPVYFYPGEVEHEAMAAGALRVLRGEEVPQTYTGIPVWEGFKD